MPSLGVRSPLDSTLQILICSSIKDEFFLNGLPVRIISFTGFSVFNKKENEDQNLS